jgi:prepilin-type N-terminal cleavage/methylation domain-containing protein
MRWRRKSIIARGSMRCLRGFTLLEMMLAIGILAIVLVMIAGSFNAVVHSKVQGEEHLSVDREGRAIVWELAYEIRGAVQTPPRVAISHVVLIGNGQMRNGQPLDSITVSTLAAGHRRAITGYGTEDLVSYSATPNPHYRKWFVLTRSQQSALGGGSSMTPIVLADNIVQLHIKYFDGAKWFESWDSTALPPERQLPIAASIDLVLAASNGRLQNFSTQVILPMAVPVW